MTQKILEGRTVLTKLGETEVVSVGLDIGAGRGGLTKGFYIPNELARSSGAMAEVKTALAALGKAREAEARARRELEKAREWEKGEAWGADLEQVRQADARHKEAFDAERALRKRVRDLLKRAVARGLLRYHHPLLGTPTVLRPASPFGRQPLPTEKMVDRRLRGSGFPKRRARGL